jgi:hypothetical protein
VNYGQLAYSSGQLQTPGDSQYSLYVLRNQTPCTNFCSAKLYLDGISQEIALPANRSFAFTVSLVARAQGPAGNTTTVYHIRGGASGSSQIANTTAYEMPLNELGLTPANVSITASSGFLHITVAGSYVPLVWTATVQNTEIAY